MKTMNANDIVITNVAMGTVIIEPGSTFGQALSQYDTSKAPAASLLHNRFFDGDNELGLSNVGDVLQPGTMITVYAKDAFDNGVEGNCEGCSDLSVECSDPANHRPGAPLVEGQHTAEVAVKPTTLQQILDNVEAGITDLDNDPLGIGADAFVNQQYDLSKLPEEVRSIVAELDTNNDGFIDSMEAVAQLAKEVDDGDIKDGTGLVAAQSAADAMVEGRSEAEPGDDDEEDDGSDAGEDDDLIEELVEAMDGEPSAGDIVDPDAPVVEGQHTAVLEAPKAQHADAFNEETNSYEIAKLPEADQATAREVDTNQDGFITADEYSDWLLSQLGMPAVDSDLN